MGGESGDLGVAAVMLVLIVIDSTIVLWSPPLIKTCLWAVRRQHPVFLIF